ncbi:T-cell surface glycoprotein CD3 epsilon chain-like [Scleropages formosus]|uniref:T-cell surface glycoprotein CD3 epsilon chain n=1 Tax=Scleropages formosus TaxID=113540 RepID=A0A8C9V0P1_SCLFO|nr:T-cell surface glycoprotein CD3 epsilon chain [Scleropages formosus]XP_018603857.1 T-cell surface glycoprotein CD3 epsilon chain [Scleropages formosus]
MERLLIFFSLCLAVMADSGDVTFNLQTLTLTCPKEAKSLKHKDVEIKDADINPYVVTYTEEKQGLYECSYEEDEATQIYYFYVKGKVGDNLYELDGFLVAGIIVGDLLVTAGIVIIIYLWAQKKSAAAARVSAGRSAPPRSAPRGPAVPNRDYEPLNLRTRDNATYAVAGVNRTG